jgi:hypothetical protein
MLYFLSWLAPSNIQKVITPPVVLADGNTIKVPGLNETMLINYGMAPSIHSL